MKQVVSLIFTLAALFTLAPLSGAAGRPDVGPSPRIFTCRDDRDFEAQRCEAACRKLPEDDKKGRRDCWKACSDERARCYEQCKE